MIGQPLSKLKTRDALLWSLNVGRMHSRNNIIVEGDRAFLSTSGDEWGRPDSRDGVVCLDLKSGSKIWFSSTNSDANEVALFESVLLAGTDDGEIFAIRTEDGSKVARLSASASVYTKAIILEVESRRLAILLSHKGEVIQYDIVTEQFSIIGTIPYSVRANPVAIKPNAFLAGTESGEVVLVEVHANGIMWKKIFKVEPYRSSGQYSYELGIKGVSSIVVTGDRAVVSYARDTYDRRPPMVCFSLATHQKLWDAGRIQSASKEDEQTFGNSRVTPAVWKNLLISTFAYNESVHAFQIETGKWMWRVRLDDSYFQNWSSPIVEGDMAYVARVNGVVSAVDLNAKKIFSAYSVEVLETADDLDSDRFQLKESRDAWPRAADKSESGGPWPGQRLVAGICSTPTIWRGNILVGTVSGEVACLRPPSVGQND